MPAVPEPARRLALGQWYTPPEVADLALAMVLPRDRAERAELRLLDPACGDGVFLARAVAAGVGCPRGIELDPSAAAAARSSVPAAQVRCADLFALKAGSIDPLGFDAVVGNPPYVRQERMGPRRKQIVARCLAADWPDLPGADRQRLVGRADLATSVVARALRLCRPGGRIALVVSSALLDAGYAGALWRLVERHGRVAALVDAPRERWFRDAAVNAVILVIERAPAAGSPSSRATRSPAATGAGAIGGPDAAIGARAIDRPDAATEAGAIGDPDAATEAGATGGPDGATGAGAIGRPDAATGAGAIGRPDAATRAGAIGGPDAAPWPSLDPGRVAIARLRVSTAEARCVAGLADLAAVAEVREAPAASPQSWAEALRAPAAWFEFARAAGDRLVPLGSIAEVRRGVTSGANDIFYLARERAAELGIEADVLAPLLRSPREPGAETIAVDPGSLPTLALLAPPGKGALARFPGARRYVAKHAGVAGRPTLRVRPSWWALPARAARLFLTKAYAARFVQRLAPSPIVADQRLYSLHPRAGVDLDLLAAVLNSTYTALALEALGRASLGEGALEWTVADAARLPVLDPRRIDGQAAGALAVMARRPIGGVLAERERTDRAHLDRAVGGPLAGQLPAIHDALCDSVTRRAARAHA